MKLRVGIVGSSWWTEAMYLPALADHEAATVEAICGLRRAPAASVASRWGIRQVFDSAEQMLTSGEIDAVVIATPNNLHVSIARVALDMGMAVLCDKPLALTAGDAYALANLAEDNRVTTMVPFTYRYMPTSQLVRRLLSDGAVGEPRHLNARYYAGYAHDGAYAWRWDRGIAGSGVIGDLGSHWLDLARWMLGEVVAVSAHATTFVPKGPRPDGRHYDVTEDHAVLHTRHANGAIATLEVSAVGAEGSSFGQKHLLEVHGSDGSIEAVNDWERVQQVRVFNRGSSGGHQIATWPEDIVAGLRMGSVADTYHDVFRTTETMTRAWATAAAAGQRCEPDFRVGARIQELVDAAVRSDASGGSWQLVTDPAG